jgi:hypothetical protein
MVQASSLPPSQQIELAAARRGQLAESAFGIKRATRIFLLIPMVHAAFGFSGEFEI